MQGQQADTHTDTDTRPHSPHAQQQGSDSDTDSKASCVEGKHSSIIPRVQLSCICGMQGMSNSSNCKQSSETVRVSSAVDTSRHTPVLRVQVLTQRVDACLHAA